MRKSFRLLALTFMMMSLCVPIFAQQPQSAQVDTTKYSYPQYRIPEGQTYEEFIRKLPGVEILEDGTITVNGKKVDRILINGPVINEEDTTLQHLTAEMIEKVKAYENLQELQDYEYIIEIKPISDDVKIEYKGKKNPNDNKIFLVPEGTTIKELISQLPKVETDKDGSLITKSSKDIVTSIEFNGGKIYPENISIDYPDDYKLRSGVIHVVIMDRKHFRKYMSKKEGEGLPKRRAEISISYYPGKGKNDLLINMKYYEGTGGE